MVKFLLYYLIELYLGTFPFKRIADMTRMLIDVDIPGLEKREKVLEFAKQEYGFLAERLGDQFEIVMDAVIAVVRWKANDTA